jgi:hypothetical protein
MEEGALALSLHKGAIKHFGILLDHTSRIGFDSDII